MEETDLILTEFYENTIAEFRLFSSGSDTINNFKLKVIK
jgi:hypothetical protein